MTQQLLDKTGACVTVGLDATAAISAYTLHTADGSGVGRADFLDSTDPPDERIFFHTEVDPAVGGRGLGGILVRQALADSILTDVTVVPVCPLFAAHLKAHGEEFVAAGGRFRRPRPADLMAVARATRSAS